MGRRSLDGYRSPHELAWRRQGPVVFNLLRGRPDRGIAFVRLIPDPTPQYGAARGRRFKRPCLMSGVIGQPSGGRSMQDLRTIREGQVPGPGERGDAQSPHNPAPGEVGPDCGRATSSGTE